MYDILAKPVQNFLLLDLTTSASILECRVWGNGVVAITADMQLYVAEVGLDYDNWHRRIPLYMSSIKASCINRSLFDSP
jgi:hypothetical protein